MTNKFCHFLSNGYTINIIDERLTWRPCCVYEKKVFLDEVESFNNELARTSAATDWLPECGQCKSVEQSGITGYKSMRQLSFDRAAGEHEPGDCVQLEVNFDKQCNAACLSCSPAFSSTWEKYSRKYEPDFPITCKDEFEEFVSRVDLSKLKTLYIQGGEPFFSDTSTRILQHVMAVHPAVDQITLMYQTNGSILPDPEILSFWPRFKEVQLRYSIDGVGERFEYLRWPLNWQTVDHNVKTMIDTTNVKIHVNCTVNPLSSLYFDEVENWVNQTIPQERLIRLRAGYCLGNMDLSFATKDLKKQVQEKYGPDHQMFTMFDKLPTNRSWQSMITYVEKHDRLRNLDWRKIFPESVKFYQTNI